VKLRMRQHGNRIPPAQNPYNPVGLSVGMPLRKPGARGDILVGMSSTSISFPAGPCQAALAMSVLVKSSPLNSSGSPEVLASA
jgi:hypothetical protein